MARHFSRARRREIASRKYIDPEQHQERFLLSLRGELRKRDAGVSTGRLIARGAVGVKVDRPGNTTFYRFEGVTTNKEFCISDTESDWPIIDKLFDAVRALVESGQQNRLQQNRIDSLAAQINSV